MKKIKHLLLCIILLAFLSSCKIVIGNNSSDLSSEISHDLSSQNSSVSDTSSTTTDVTTTPKPTINYSKKVFSKDGFFSLSYYISSKNLNVNDELTISTKFTNESNENFKIGISDIKMPVNIAIIKKGDPWGYEGNSDPLSSTVKSKQEIIQTYKNKVKEPGVFQIFIFTDFAREIKSFENASTVDKNFYDEKLANSSIMIDVFEITIK